MTLIDMKIGLMCNRTKKKPSQLPRQPISKDIFFYPYARNCCCIEQCKHYWPIYAKCIEFVLDAFIMWFSILCEQQNPCFIMTNKPQKPNSLNLPMHNLNACNEQHFPHFLYYSHGPYLALWSPTIIIFLLFSLFSINAIKKIIKLIWFCLFSLFRFFLFV